MKAYEVYYNLQPSGCYIVAIYFDGVDPHFSPLLHLDEVDEYVSEYISEQYPRYF